MSNYNTDEEKNSPSAKDQEQGTFPLFTPQFQTDSDKPPSSDLVAAFGDASAVPTQQSGWGDSFKSTNDNTKPKEMRDKWATTPPSAGLWSNVPPTNPSHSGSTIGLAFGAFNPSATSGQAVLAADPLTLIAAEGRSLITGHVDLATLICKPSEIGQKASTQKKQPGAPKRADAAQAENKAAGAPSSNARANVPAKLPTPEQPARAKDALHPANPITAGSRNPTPDAPAPVAPPLPPKPSPPPTPTPVAPAQPDPAPYAAAIQNQFSNQQDLLASPPAPPLAPQQAGLEKSFFDERPEGSPVRQTKTSERFTASRRLTDEPAKPDLKTTVPDDNSGAASLRRRAIPTKTWLENTTSRFHRRYP